VDRNIVFVHRGGPSSASYRYRALEPAKHVSKINGFSCSINGGAADIIVFSKPQPDDVPMMEAAKKDGCKVVADFCDDHFQHPSFAFYKDMVKGADFVVAPTKVMAERILEHTGRVADAVIPDAYEEAEREPHAEGNKILWFGHNVNVMDLRKWMGNLKDWDFTILTGPKLPEEAKSRLWTPESQTEELARANIVFLPTRKGAEYKTNNRLLNSIRAGCFPVCAQHPAYIEFKDMVWVGDCYTGLRWVKAFSGDLNGLVKQAQDYIREKYSPAAIGALWAKAMEAV
jgi:hypothetical protein